MAEKQDRTAQLLKQVIDHFENEDRSVRERQIRLWRRLKLYWDGFQNVWWSEVAHDWRIYDEQRESKSSSDQQYYDKPVNVFRAYLESIIAALSVVVPPIKCVPDDAEDPLDISTAKAGDIIAKLIYKHNDAILLWLHALYIFCTEGLVACYNYTEEDAKYGMIEQDKFEDKEVDVTNYYCPECDYKLEKDEYDPSDEYSCINCSNRVIPDARSETSTVTRLVGKLNKPKARQKLEVYGGLYVKIPNYAMKQSDIPYLIFSYETHYSNVIDRYPKLRDKFAGAAGISGVYDPYEQWARLNPQYRGEYPINNVTCRNCWLRPSAFEVLPEEDAKYLKEKFPSGAYAVFINDTYADSRDENLDDHWTLDKNPLSDYLHHDPLGLLLVSVQDITNDIVSLVVQTIEQGITQVFADPATLDFEAYGKTEIAPGTVFPAKPRSGKTLGESFFEIRTANLSGEILPFTNRINELGQLVSGALPSLFGGSAESGSKTASEYSMSRAQARQRLQTHWYTFSIWWKEIFGKVIPAYIKTVLVDEKIVSKDDLGNYVNVYIRKADLQGKIGDIELEASDQLPITWAQRRDVIMQLLQAGNPIIIEALTLPENLPFLKEAIGIDQFKVPGDEDRQKQFEEIQLLVTSEPIVIPEENPETGEIIEQESPSVDVNLLLDDHKIEADICRRWLISDVGRLNKIENEPGYRNVLLHMKLHLEAAAQQIPVQGSAEPSGESRINQSLAAPNTGGGNVPVGIGQG
jgi:DNA-directed RNA polymerase subunit RPC12/RpoP